MKGLYLKGVLFLGAGGSDATKSVQGKLSLDLIFRGGLDDLRDLNSDHLNMTGRGHESLRVNESKWSTLRLTRPWAR